MAFYLFWPDAELLRAQGFDAVAHVPCIFGNDWTYQRWPSRYLRERALLEWAPRTDAAVLIPSSRYPTRKTLEVYGYALCNFLEWCEARGIDVSDVTYTRHLYLGYQAEMLDGRWWAAGRRLSLATVNLRLLQAMHYVQWAADRGLRQPFQAEVLTRKVPADTHRSSTGHRALHVNARAGGVRPNPKNLVMPTDEQVRLWFESVRIERGATKALMCELILQTGIRREEAAEWRVDTLPLEPSSWAARGDFVNVLIKHGTKGSKFSDGSGELVGPSRHIQVPIALAERLARYREFARPSLRALFVRSAETPQDRRARMAKPPKQLFLSDSTGMPITAARLYEAWTGVSRLPFPGWAPHQGRHYWACKTLLGALQRRRNDGVSGDALSPAAELDWVVAAASS